MLMTEALTLRILTLCSSRKYPYPPHGYGWSLEIPRGPGGGGSKGKIFKAKYEAKLEFLEGGGVVLRGGGFKVKHHLWRRCGYFLEPHIEN